MDWNTEINYRHTTLRRDAELIRAGRAARAARRRQALAKVGSVLRFDRQDRQARHAQQNDNFVTAA